MFVFFSQCNNTKKCHRFGSLHMLMLLFFIVAYAPICSSQSTLLWNHFHLVLWFGVVDKEPCTEVFFEGSEKWNQRTCPTATTKAKSCSSISSESLQEWWHLVSSAVLKKHSYLSHALWGHQIYVTHHLPDLQNQTMDSRQIRLPSIGTLAWTRLFLHGLLVPSHQLLPPRWWKVCIPVCFFCQKVLLEYSSTDSYLSPRRFRSWNTGSKQFLLKQYRRPSKDMATWWSKWSNKPSSVTSPSVPRDIYANYFYLTVQNN